MARRLRIALAILSALALLAACGSGDDDDGGGGEQAAGEAGEGSEERPDKLVFAAVPSGEATTFEAHYGLVARAISEELDIEVETFQAADYAGVIEALIAGTVDLAQLGAFSYALAIDNGAEIEPAGVLIHTEDAEPGYVILGVAPAGSGYSGLEDFAGKTVCFPDPASTTTLLPLFELNKADIDADTDLEQLTVPAGNTIPRTVVQGDCEVGFTADVQLENAINTGDIEESDLEVFWELQAPGSPVAMRTALPADFREELEAAVTSINADYLEDKGWCTGDDCLITANRDYGYVPVEHEYYQVIWDACEATRIEACGSIGQ